VLLPEPPFCVTNAMVRMFIPSDGFWKWQTVTRHEL